MEVVILNDVRRSLLISPADSWRKARRCRDITCYVRPYHPALIPTLPNYSTIAPQLSVFRVSDIRFRVRIMVLTSDIGGCWSRRPNFEELSRLGLALEHARNAVRVGLPSPTITPFEA